jgi:hypothetical protein
MQLTLAHHPITQIQSGAQTRLEGDHTPDRSERFRSRLDKLSGAQLPNTFFKRSMISGGWVVTSLAILSSSSPVTGWNS